MPEIWKPEPREIFETEGREQKEANQSLRYLQEVLQQTKGMERIDASFGSKLGKAFIRVYETNGDKLKPEEFMRIQKTMRNLLGERGNMYISGFLSELATATIFKEIDLDIYYALEEEDLHEGIDWWVDLSDLQAGAVPIQVKAVPFRENVKNEVIYPLWDRESLDQLMDEVVTPYNLDLPDSHAEEIQRKIYGSGRKLLRAAYSKYSNAKPVMMLLNSPNSAGAQFNTLTGKPSRDLIDKVLDRLEHLQMTD